MMWIISASGKASDVRTSVAKQFAAAAVTSPGDNARASAASFIDGVLAIQGAATLMTVKASGAQGVHHPEGHPQNLISISIAHNDAFQT